MKRSIYGISAFIAGVLASCSLSGVSRANDILLDAEGESAVPTVESVMESAKVETAPAAESIQAETAAISTTAVSTTTAQAATETVPAETAAPVMVYQVKPERRFEFSGNAFATWWDGFGAGNSLNLDQIWLTGERAIDTETYGFDWGYRVDALFGTNDARCFNDGGFDGNWNPSNDGYVPSIYQIYAEVGVGNFSLKVGKFGTLIGYESVDVSDRLFNSTSYMYDHEPSTHCGGLLTYDMTEKLSFNFGITTGSDTSFENEDGDIGFLFGVGYQLTDSFYVGYAAHWASIHGGEDGDRSNNSYDYYDVFGGEPVGDHDEYLHTVTISWDITDRFNYSFVTNYGSMTPEYADSSVYDQFGIANYFSYELTEKLTLALRYEWFNQSAEIEGETADANYHDLSLGAVYRPTENIMIRPEIRYDWINEMGEKDEGFAGGIGVGFFF